MRIGIIGTGRHGARYARHIIEDLPELRLVAISRRGKEGAEQARAWTAAYYRDWRDLVASPEVEAVIAVTTPNLHLAIAESCAAHRKPLLLEKPLATDGVTAERIVSLFERANLPLTVGQTLRYNPVIMALRRELGRVGALHHFSACHRLEQNVHSWLDLPEVAGGGVILHSAVHLFDALRFITGKEVRRVRALVGHRHTSRLEDLFVGLVEMEGGLLGTVDASKIGPARCGRYEFVGNAGQLQGDQVHGFLEFVKGAEIVPLLHSGPAPAILPLLLDWQAWLNGRRANPVPAEDGLAAVRICDACLLSAREDRWVTLA
ncbi:Gfo/Idh/MocA family protein [Thiovibrio sp. JS02]